jgi:hypothetical protein
VYQLVNKYFDNAEIDKYTKNKLALFTRFYRDAQSTKHKKSVRLSQTSEIVQ